MSTVGRGANQVRPPQDPERPPSPGQVGSFFWLVLPAAIAALFSRSIWLGKTLYCAVDEAPADICWKGAHAAEAGMLTLAAGFLVGTFIGTYAVHRRGTGTEAVLTSVVGAIVGGTIAVVEATAVDNVATNAAFEPLFFVFVAALIFILPLALTPHSDRRFDEAVAYSFRLAVAALLGGLFTIIVQVFPLLLPDRLFAAGGEYVEPGDKTFLLVRPVATGLLMSPWILITYDPILRPWIWRGCRRKDKLVWMWSFLIIAVALVAIYALVNYIPEHSAPTGWLERSGLSATAATLIYCALLLPPLFAAGVALLVRKRNESVTSEVAVIFLVAASGGMLVPVILVTNTGMPVVNAALLGSLHVIASLLVLGASRLSDSLSRRVHAPPPTSEVG